MRFCARRDLYILFALLDGSTELFLAGTKDWFQLPAPFLRQEIVCFSVTLECSCNRHDLTQHWRIKLTSLAKGIIERRATARKGIYLFPHEDDPDRPVPKVNNAHDAALKNSGVDHFVLYDCRHIWATRAVEAGVDLVTLAAMMGHSRIQMVLRYAHPSQEHQFKAMDIVEKHVAAGRIALAEKNQSIALQTIR